MNRFADLNIKPAASAVMIGDKIKIERILNKEIIVHSFKIEKSVYEGKGSGKCLYLQIELSGEKRVVFTSSNVLMDMIQQIPENKFPVSTTITKQDNGAYQFN